MLKSPDYTRCIHSFNHFFNIFTPAFHSINRAGSPSTCPRFLPLRAVEKSVRTLRGFSPVLRHFSVRRKAFSPIQHPLLLLLKYL
jgi:hypothetical protein